MSNPAPTLNQINAFNVTQGTTIDFNIIGGTEVIRSNKIYIYDLSDNSLICTHLYVSTESIHELPPNTDGSIVYESGKSSADFVNGAQYYAQIQTFTDIAGTEGGSGLSVAKMFWCLVDPTLTITTIPSTISTTSYNVSATYNANTSVVSNIIQQYQFSLYSATGSLLQSSGVVVGSGEQQGTSTAYDISYNFSGLSVGSSYYVVVDVTTTQGMSVSVQSNTFTVSIDTPTLGEATVVNNACDGYISVTSNLSSEYGGSGSGEIVSFETDSENVFTKLQVDLEPIQDLNGYDAPWVGGAGKNKLSNNYYEKSVTSRNGITYTVNDDGSVTLQGTNTAQGVSNWEMIFTGSPSGLKAGTYIISADGLQNGVQIVFGGDVSSIPYNTVTYQNTSRQFTLSSDDATMGYCLIQVNGGATINTTIFPMIRLATETDATFAPYENICPIFAPTTSKNKIPYPYILGSNTVNGITYTDNGDGTLTINGTATDSAFYDLGNVSRNYFELPAGTYTFAGSGNAGVSVTLCKIVNGSGQFFRNANTTAVTFTITETASYYFYVVVNSGTTVNNLIIKPQLEEGAVATPFRPYGENVQVKQIAKNLLDLQYRSYSAQQNVRYYRNGGGGVKLYAGKTYTLSVADDNTMPAGIYMNKYDPSAASHPSVAYRYNARSVTYTPSEDVVIETDCYYATVPTEGIENIKVQLEISDTATTYEPYNGQSYTTQLGQTVYGGTLDLVSGELTVTHGIVDLGTLDWIKNTNASKTYFQTIAEVADMKKSTGNFGIQPILCSNYKTETWAHALDNATYDGVICEGWTNKSYIGIADSTKVSLNATSFKTAMDGVQLVYELASPTTYQLTPQQIQTLVGGNNVWSEQGDVELSYHIPITNLLVKRQDVGDVSGNWLTLYSQPITQASDMDFTFIDFLNQYGKTYKYALVPLLTQTQSGVVVQIEGGYTVSDNVDSIFDGVYIADQTNVERVKAGVGYGNIDMNQGVGSITPIGSKYPIVITNSQNQYHNGSVRGTIVPNDFYSNGNLSRIDMVNKRDELEQFLTNKRAKIIKDWNGNIWLVMIMSNVACSFDDNYGMGMVSFSADWLEVGDPTNQQDLYNAGLINVGGV